MLKIAFVYRKLFMDVPLGLGYIISAIKDIDGVEIKVFAVTEKTCCKVEEEIVSFSPHLVGYSVIFGQQKLFYKLNTALRAKIKFFSLFGGPLATYFPEMSYKKDIDFICRGEGEKAVRDLVLGLLENNLKLNNRLHIKGLNNGITELEHNLDLIKFPERELFFKVNKGLQAFGVHPVIASRGCPYGCTYCYNSIMQRKYKIKNFRYRTVDNVINELLQLKEICNLKIVKFFDDNLIFDEKWLEDFVAQYKKKINLPIMCNIHINFLNARVASLLRELSPVYVTFGLESGSEKNRRLLLNRFMSDEAIIEAAKLLKRNNIPFRTENMFCLPGETFKEALATYFLNLKIKPDNTPSALFQPYPKLPLTDKAIEMGVLDKNKISDIFRNYYDYSVLDFTTVKEKNKIMNLHYFTAFLIKFPFMYPVIKKLLWFKPNFIFRLIYRLIDSYDKYKLLKKVFRKSELYKLSWRALINYY